MHSIVAFAGHPGAASSALVVPALEAILAQWREVDRDTLDPQTLNAPHERAWAGACFTEPFVDGGIPWAQRQAQSDGADWPGVAMGMITPVHWRVTTDGIELADPLSCALDDKESAALFAALEPLLIEDGFQARRATPSRWYVTHRDLGSMRCASLHRAAGRRMDAWQPKGPLARTWLRLQNEAQMLWHAHPVNEAREARGELPLNSMWLSGTGDARPIRPRDTQVRVDERLRLVRHDERAWLDTWAAIDREWLAPMLGTPDTLRRLTLCGEATSITYAPAPRIGWPKWLRAKPPTARTVLASL